MPFEIVPQSEYLLIKLTGECQGDESPSLAEAFTKAKEESKLKLVVFQMGDCSLVSTMFLRHMSQVYREIKTTNGMMRLVGAKKQIVEQIKTNGLDRILVNKMSLKGALVDLGLAMVKEFDVNFINPFLESTQKVFKVQCFMDTRPQKPYLKKPNDPLLLGDISGVISIISETFAGTMAISLSESIFLKVAENMLGEKISAIEEKYVDLIGELANIILGQAKIILGGLGYNVGKALPSCVWGKDHKIKHFGGGVCVVIPFETDFGTFYTEVMTQSAMGESKISQSAA